MDQATFETRRAANETVDKNLRQRQIIEILKERPMTAKEIAVRMTQKGYVPYSDRNFASPRLTEMMEIGKVRTIGKTTCQFTGRTVAVFALTEGDD